MKLQIFDYRKYQRILHRVKKEAIAKGQQKEPEHDTEQKKEEKGQVVTY